MPARARAGSRPPSQSYPATGRPTVTWRRGSIRGVMRGDSPMVLRRPARARGGVVSLSGAWRGGTPRCAMPHHTTARTERNMTQLFGRLKTLAVAAPLALSIALPLAGVAHADE